MDNRNFPSLDRVLNTSQRIGEERPWQPGSRTNDSTTATSSFAGPTCSSCSDAPTAADDEDDCRIVESLRRDAGLPEWIEEAEGYQDRLGWYLKSPVQFDRTAFMAWLGKVAQAEAAAQL